MNSDLTQAILSGIRSVLITVGSVAATNGYTDDATVQAVVGAIMILISAGWGMWAKFGGDRK